MCTSPHLLHKASLHITMTSSFGSAKPQVSPHSALRLHRSAQATSTFTLRSAAPSAALFRSINAPISPTDPSPHTRAAIRMDHSACTLPQPSPYTHPAVSPPAITYRPTPGMTRPPQLPRPASGRPPQPGATAPAGKKKWTVYGALPGQELPPASSSDIPREALPKPALEVTLAPGDVLYLPRGTVHEAQALDQGSSHVTISSYQQWSWKDLLDRVMGNLAVRSLRLHAAPRGPRCVASHTRTPPRLRSPTEQSRQACADALAGAVLDRPPPPHRVAIAAMHAAVLSRQGTTVALPPCLTPRLRPGNRLP